MPAFLNRAVRGMAATEFILVSMPLLLVGLGAFEAARWNVTRQAASFALLEAARAGAVSHAEPAAIEHAFRKALQPLGDPSRRLPEGQLPWQIDILSPRPAHFIDFPGPDSDGARTVSHAYQDLQHQRALDSGRPGGRGSTSGDTIFGANTLSLRLHFLHVPLVPGMQSLVRQLGAVLPDAGFAAQAMRRSGALPIRQTVSLAMQSSPREWEHDRHMAPAARKRADGSARPMDSLTDSPPCNGIWCNAAWAGPSRQPGPAATLPPALPAVPVGFVPGSPAPLPWEDTEQACQAALCCVPTPR